MRRRDFIRAASVAVAAWPFRAHAQQKRRIGILVLGNPDPALFLKEFQEGLEKLGIDREVEITLRSAGGNTGALAAAAKDLVQMKVDVIVAWQTPAATAAKNATTEIPIVMTAGNPVGTGLVASLSRPGGNVTGLDSFGSQLAGKCVEVIRDAIPSSRRIAILANAIDPFTKSFLAEIDRVAATLQIATQPLMRRPGDDFETAFTDMRKQNADAVIVQPTLLSPKVIELALKYRMPSFSIVRALPATGGLMAYTQDASEQSFALANYTSRILKGSRPADMPISQPTRFQFVLNLKTAKALGLEISPTLLARADEIIE